MPTPETKVSHIRTLWLLATASVMTMLAISVFLTHGHRFDFAAFYIDGSAWNRNAQLYTRANLNPPSATIAAFAPLARLPFQQAQIVWTVTGFIALLACVRAVAIELQWTVRQACVATSLLLITHGAFLAFAYGQVTWLLLWPATMAWISYRRDRPYVAGAWFGVLVAVKPTVAVTALALPWPVWLTAFAVSVSTSALAISVTGWPVWLRWLETGRTVSWIEHGLSTSIWGVLARLEHVTRLNELSPATVLLALGLGVAAFWRTTSVSHPDRRVVCAWLLHATIAPLGWIYYLPLVFGPMSASWPNGPVAWLAFALFCAPIGLIGTRPFALLPGLVYPLSILCAWAAWIGSERDTMASRNGANGGCAPPNASRGA